MAADISPVCAIDLSGVCATRSYRQIIFFQLAQHVGGLQSRRQLAIECYKFDNGRRERP